MCIDHNHQYRYLCADLEEGRGPKKTRPHWKIWKIWKLRNKDTENKTCSPYSKQIIPQDPFGNILNPRVISKDLQEIKKVIYIVCLFIDYSYIDHSETKLHIPAKVKQSRPIHTQIRRWNWRIFMILVVYRRIEDGRAIHIQDLQTMVSTLWKTVNLALI